MRHFMHSSLILQEFISLLDVICNIFLIVGLDRFCPIAEKNSNCLFVLIVYNSSNI